MRDTRRIAGQRRRPRTKAPQPWRWPGQWFAQESFWRDVASRTASGLLVLFVGYVFALAAGYLAKPRVLPTLGLLIVGGLGFYQMVRRFMKKEISVRYDAWPTLIGVLIVTAVLIWAIVTGGLKKGL